MMLSTVRSPCWEPFVRRYQEGGEWRAPVFRDMVLHDIQALAACGKPNVLDIGCGGGFDGDAGLQRSLAVADGHYVGIEPDQAVELQPVFAEVYRCVLEEAPIPTDSFDVAFAVMVLEHLERPEHFWGKIYDVLKRVGFSGGSRWTRGTGL